MSRLLVTGATGMLGSYVARAALEDGREVRALVRDPASAAWLEAEGVTLVPGDLLSARSVRYAARGCDAIVHAAATIGTGSGEGRFRGNVLGTESVIDAAERAGARLLHVSSTAVIGPARYGPEPADETVRLPRLPAWDAYGRTKQVAEAAVLRAAAQGRVWAAVVRPPVMYGIRDRQFIPRVAPALRFRIVPIAGAAHATLPLVHAESVAQGALAALDRDAARGRVYHLTEDCPVTVATLWAAAGQGLRRPVRTVRVPRPALALAFVGLAGALALGGRTDLARRARGTYRMLTRPNPFSADRARLELGWDPALDPLAALAEAFRWWDERRISVGTHRTSQGAP